MDNIVQEVFEGKSGEVLQELKNQDVNCLDDLKILTSGDLEKILDVLPGSVVRKAKLRDALQPYLKSPVASLFYDPSTFDGGLVLGRYLLQEQLSSTSRTIVFSAIDQNTPTKRVVVKIALDPDDADGCSAAAQMRNEHRILTQHLEKCPGVPKVLAFSTATRNAGGLSSAVLVLVEQPLGECLKKLEYDYSHPENLSEQLTGWGKSISKTLHKIHARGVIHRDIKPNNLILLPDGSLVIIDFGLATLKAEANNAPQAGTRHYHPKELADANSPEADFVSLALSLVALETGIDRWERSTPPPVTSAGPAASQNFVPEGCVGYRLLEEYYLTFVPAALAWDQGSFEVVDSKKRHLSLRRDRIAWGQVYSFRSACTFKTLAFAIVAVSILRMLSSSRGKLIK